MRASSVLSLSRRFWHSRPFNWIPRRHSSSEKKSRLFVRGTLPKNGKGVAVNQYAETTRSFSRTEVALFGELVGDSNPLHLCLPREQLPDVQAYQETGLIRWQADTNDQISEALVPGMMVASLFSSIFGTWIPGSIYRSQTLAFRSPVFAGEKVVGRIEITKLRPSRRGVLLICDTRVIHDGKDCVIGEASVWLPHGTILAEDGES